MKIRLILRAVIASFLLFNFSSSFAQLERIKAISIDFKNFAGSEYAKLKEIESSASNDYIGETIEALEDETEAELNEKWWKQKSLEVLDNVNVANFIRNQYRWLLVHSKKDPELAIDLVSQHIITHGLEVLGGPALTAAYALNGGDPLVTGILSAGSAIIATPGLDPLCLIGFATYRYIPIYRKSFRFLRMTLFMVPKYLISKMNATQRVAWMLGTQERRSFVRRALGEKSFKELKGPILKEAKDSFSMDFKMGNEKVILDFGIEDHYKGIYLRSMSFSGDIDKVNREEIKKVSKELKSLYGWNVAQAFKQSFSRMKQGMIFGVSSSRVLEASYYIDDVKETDFGFEIRFHQDSVRSSGKKYLNIKKPEKNCTFLLAELARLAY